MLRNGLRLAGIVLIALLLWQVGWRDVVVDSMGTTHTGRLVERDESAVVIETDFGPRRIPLTSGSEVRTGLASALLGLRERPHLALAALLVQLAGFLVAQLRWQILLAAVDLPTRFLTVVRLGFIGLFFQNLLPGGVASGDLVRAIYLARAHPEFKTRAVLSLLVDRFVGLAALLAIASVGVLLAPGGTRLASARGAVFAGIGFATLVMVLVWAAPLRHNLPGLLRVRPDLLALAQELNAAIDLYRGRAGATLGAFALSGVSLSLIVASFALWGRALGGELGGTAVLIAIPIALVVSALPGLPGGWGIGDAAFYFFLPAAGVPGALAVALSFCSRIVTVLISLPGGLLLAAVRRETDEPAGR